MKKLILIIFFTFSFLNNISAQNNCPTISVTAPNSITPIGDSMIFTVHIEGIDLSKIKYEWTFSAGTLTSGQNTSTITVATNADLAGQTITAVVKISGLPQECKNEAYNSGEVQTPINGGTPRIIGEYGKLSWRDEKVRLENVVIELKNTNEGIAYFIVRNNVRNRSQVLKQREAKVQKYLFDKFKIAKDRIKFVDGGIDDENTRIYIMPTGAVPPQ